MLTAGDIAERIAPATLATPADEVRARFVADPDLDAIPVLDPGGRLRWVVFRAGFLAFGSTAFGHSLMHHRALDVGLPPACARQVPSCGAGLQLNEAAAVLMSVPGPRSERAVAVVEDGCYLGLLTPPRVMDALLRAGREHESELERARATAERNLRARDSFLANMSHEIRTPLTAILGFTDLAADLAQDADQREMLGFVHEAGQGLLAIINDILDLAKIESGRLAIASDPCSPAQVADEVVRLLAPRAMAKGLTLHLVAAGVPGLVLGDAQRLRQVLLNLVGNAVKFTDHGGVEVGLGWSAEGGGRLVCAVSDTGVGIAPHDLQRLFAPFSQVDESLTRRHGGTGLGLVISRQFAELMGGGIAVRSALGQGSTFTVTVRAPAAAVDGVGPAPRLAAAAEGVQPRDDARLCTTGVR